MEKSRVPETSEFRFSIRSLLMLMLGVAAVAAGIGPFLRGLEAQEIRSVALLWGLCAAMLAAVVGYRVWTRIRLEQAGGRVRAELSVHGKWFRNVRPWQTVTTGSLLLLLGLYYLVLFSAVPMEPVSSIGRALMAGVITFLMSRGIAVIWWDRRVQLRENGVLRGLRLLRWSHVTHQAFVNEGTLFHLVLEGVDQRHRDVRYEMNVRPDQRACVESRLRLIPRGDRLAAYDGSQLAGAMARTPAITITEETQVTSSGLFNAFLVLVGVSIASSVLRTISVSAPQVSFVIGAITMCVAGFALYVYRTASTWKSGTPLIRLKSKTDWLTFAGAGAVIAAAYWIDQALPWESVGLSFALGAVCGAGAVAVQHSLGQHAIDLCENGVVLLRTAFWPWEKVRVLTWNRTGKGRLLVRCGWRRMAAKVREEQREAVDALLREKQAIQDLDKPASGS